MCGADSWSDGAGLGGERSVDLQTGVDVVARDRGGEFGELSNWQVGGRNLPPELREHSIRAVTGLNNRGSRRRA